MNFGHRDITNYGIFGMRMDQRGLTLPAGVAIELWQSASTLEHAVDPGAGCAVELLLESVPWASRKQARGR